MLLLWCHREIPEGVGYLACSDVYDSLIALEDLLKLSPEHSKSISFSCLLHDVCIFVKRDGS